MANRNRDIVLRLYVDDNEQQMINNKMTSLGTRNFNSYARKMLIDGYIIKTDFTELRKLLAELGKIGSNINQIAWRTNETRNFYADDMADILRDWNELTAVINNDILKIIRLK